MPDKMKKNLAPWLWGGLGLGIMLFLSGLINIDYTKPFSFWGDHFYFISNERRLIDTGNMHESFRSGFPSHFQDYMFPSFDRLFFLAMDIAAFLFKSPIEAWNFITLIMYMSVFIVMFIVINRCAQDNFMALFGALVLMFIPYISIRTGDMDLLLAFFCVPCAFFMGYRLAFPTKADDGTGPSSFFKSFPIIVSVIIIALSNIYYIAFSLIFLCVIATALALQQRRIRPISIFILSTVGIICIFTISIIPLIKPAIEQGMKLPGRSFTDQILFGTRISDIIMTFEPYVSLPKAADYWDLRRNDEGKDFWPGPLLSLFSLAVILSSPLILRKEQAKTPLQSTQAQFNAALIAFLMFSLLFSMVWGFGILFNLFVIPTIRSQNRISIFFAFTAVMLLINLLQEWRQRGEKNARSRSLFVFLWHWWPMITHGSSLYRKNSKICCPKHGIMTK